MTVADSTTPPDDPLAPYDFELPEALIALRPASPRRASRLLVSSAGGLLDSATERLPGHLRPGDLLVFNDTKVIPARLTGLRRRAGAAAGEGVARVEATLVERLGPAAWRALARPGKRLRLGDPIAFADGALSAEVAAIGEGGAVELRFDRAGAALDAAIADVGAMPLPPYIATRRPPDARDAVDYQTVLARAPGAVAAPTAALHFDATLLAALEAQGVERACVTLHVGAGTFLPASAERLASGRLHAEWAEASAQTADRVNAARARGGRVIAVGTTSLRVLETACGPDRRIRPFVGETTLFLRPGVPIRSVDGLMTNFHLPRSTLAMLVASLIGIERFRTLYAHAVRQGYRFYSYGDAGLLWP